MFSPHHTVHVIYPSIRCDPAYKSKCFLGVPPDASTRYKPGPLISSQRAAKHGPDRNTLRCTKFYSIYPVTATSEAEAFQHLTMADVMPILRAQHGQQRLKADAKQSLSHEDMMDEMATLQRYAGKTNFHLNTILDAGIFYVSIVRESYLIYQIANGTLALSKFPDETYVLTLRTFEIMASRNSQQLWLTHMDDLIFQRSDRAVLHSTLRRGDMEYMRQPIWKVPRDLTTSSEDTNFNEWERMERSLADLDKSRGFSSSLCVNAGLFHMAFEYILDIAALEPTTSTPADLQPQGYAETKWLCDKIIAYLQQPDASKITLPLLYTNLIAECYRLLNTRVKEGGVYVSTSDQEKLASTNPKPGRYLQLCPDMMSFVELSLKRALKFVALRRCRECKGQGGFHLHGLKRFYDPDDDVYR